MSAETLSRTTLKTIKAGDPVNLEKALRVGDRLGGHIVLGHVDGVGRILEKTVRSRSVIFCFEIDPELCRYVVAKGSITVDGISLTVNRCEKDRFYVNIIPHTAAVTTSESKRRRIPSTSKRISWRRYLEKLIQRRERDTVARKAALPEESIMDSSARHGFLK